MERDSVLFNGNGKWTARGHNTAVKETVVAAFEKDALFAASADCYLIVREQHGFFAAGKFEFPAGGGRFAAVADGKKGLEFGFSDEGNRLRCCILLRIDGDVDIVSVNRLINRIGIAVDAVLNAVVDDDGDITAAAWNIKYSIRHPAKQAASLLHKQIKRKTFPTVPLYIETFIKLILAVDPTKALVVRDF